MFATRLCACCCRRKGEHIISKPIVWTCICKLSVTASTDKILKARSYFQFCRYRRRMRTDHTGSHHHHHHGVYSDSLIKSKLDHRQISIRSLKREYSFSVKHTWTRFWTKRFIKQRQILKILRCRNKLDKGCDKTLFSLFCRWYQSFSWPLSSHSKLSSQRLLQNVNKKIKIKLVLFCVINHTYCLNWRGLYTLIYS